MSSVPLFRLICLSFIFLLGLFCLDRGLYDWGTSLATSPYWHSEISNRVTHAEKIDILIVGGCRAALHFDSSIIENRVKLKTFNSGKAAVGIGHMEFTLNSGLAYQKPKYVLIVIDPNNLEESLDTTREDLIKSIPWISKLKPSDKEYFTQKYQLNSLIYKTGLYAFMGKGDELIRSALRKSMNRDVVITDGYEPRDVKQNINKDLTNEKEYQKTVKNIKKELSSTDFAFETYKNMIELVKKNGAEPILVVTPMHRLYATDDLNNKVREIILDLGKKEAIHSFVYLDNHSSISNKNELWSDTGHLNQLGAELFTNNFTKDLELYLNQSQEIETVNRI